MTLEHDSLRHTPLYEEHLLLGAQMVPFAGYEMPIQYAGIVEEHNACRHDAAVFDISHMATFRLSGRDAEAFLRWTCTNDTEKISQVGTAQYTLLLNEAGMILDDLIVYRTGDSEFMIIANASNHAKDFAWLEAHLGQFANRVGTEDGAAEVSLTDESDKMALIAVQGPKALDVVGELAGEGFTFPERFCVKDASLDGVASLVARTGYTGEDGVEIVCPASGARRIWRSLLSFAEVTPAGLGARDTLRLEMGYALYGQDITEETDPISAGLGWVVRKTGGFIGAEAIESIRETKPQRKLAYLLLHEGTGIPRAGYPILHNGVEVGKVASGSFSPTLGVGIASGYVPAGYASPGEPFEVQIRKKTAKARVVKPPFVTDTSLA